MDKLEAVQNVKNIPTIFVIFGATGDLAKKRIFPALFKLQKSDLLPEKIKIISTGRTQYSSDDFRKYLGENIDHQDNDGFGAFTQKIDYLPLDISQNINLDQIKTAINSFEDQTGSCPQVVFYMSIAPNIVESAIENLGKDSLSQGCAKHHNPPRIIIEKPFGFDLESAKKLKETLEKDFKEEQIYRIDHYLGKETVQNIFAFRFGNQIFEPIWNNRYIDHVQITTAEHIGVEKRGEFYDKTGALRDITQNHLLQLLSLITMEEPESFTPENINKQKLEILKNIKPMNEEEIENSTIRGQYEGYDQEEKIASDSKTETYALAKFHVQNERWQGVPFYLRTGKKMPGKVTSIILEFKEKEHKLLENFEKTNIPNHITIQIQPNEGIGIRLAAKKPGTKTELEPVDMEFCYKTSFDTPQPEAYERLLLDVVLGDQSLFLSQEIIESCWKIIDPIEKVWQSGKPNLQVYKPGSWGPNGADNLIEKDGRQWLAPILAICKI